jgi:hypothetical protein
MSVSMSKSDVAQQVQVGEAVRYEEAERLVSWLADEQFPVEQLTIVGCDLQLHEQVSARLSWSRAALGGLATGAWIGLFAGLLFGLFATTTAGGFTVMASGALYGAVLGAIFAVGAYAFSRRDYLTRSQLVPARYLILADPAHADRARDQLASTR